MASIISAGTTSGTALNMAGDTSGVLELATNGSTTAITIDASQRAAFVAGTAAAPAITTTGDTNTGIWFPAADTIAFAEGGAESMRIDSSGNVLVGVTSPGSYAAGSAIGTTGYISRSGTGGSFGNNRFNIFWNGSAARLWIDTVDQGSIAISSDYRIKKDIQSQTLTAIDRINEIRPVTYTYADNEVLNWKADGVAREGFIAHELAEIIPSAVDGEKDAENQIQSLKLDALCSVMVKAIQEQQTIINDLKARVETLEAN